VLTRCAADNSKVVVSLNCGIFSSVSWSFIMYEVKMARKCPVGVGNRKRRLVQRSGYVLDRRTRTFDHILSWSSPCRLFRLSQILRSPTRPDSS